MKAWIAAAAAGLILIAILYFARSPRAARPVPAPPPAPAVALPPPTPEAPVPKPDSSPAALRRLARESGDSLRELIARLSDPTLDRETWARVALVLGSLSDEAAWQALFGALTGATDPFRIRVLLLAIGSDREYPEDDRFSFAGRPWAVEVAGLQVLIHHDLTRDDARRLVASFLGHADAEVRRAAIAALYASMDHADARGAMIRSLESEPEPDARAHAGKSLAEWVAGAPGPERTDLLARLLREGGRAEQGELRLRTQQHFFDASLSGEEARTFLALAGSGPDDARRWGLEIAARNARGDLELPVVQAAGAILSRDPGAKLRETAARVLGGFPNRPEAAAGLLGALEDPAWHVRVQAVRAIRRFPKSPARAKALERAAADADERVRRAAGD